MFNNFIESRTTWSYVNFYPESLTYFSWKLAGLLTLVLYHTFPIKISGLEVWNKHSARRTKITVAGTVLDFHQIPF